MKSKTLTLSVLALLGFNLAACNLLAPAAQEQEDPTPLPPVVIVVTATPESIPPLEASPTATVSGQVIITSVTGSLNIRRGPGVGYNWLAFFQIGQSAVATGRDANGGWVYIPLPDNPSASGWVAAQTQYTTVEGDINSLPVIPTSPPMPVSIRNCTYHPMLIQPGNLLLKPQNESGNVSQVNPGDYTATDQSVSAQVLAIKLLEGNTIDIVTDGLGNTYSCP
jgi:hypothetical protein